MTRLGHLTEEQSESNEVQKARGLGIEYFKTIGVYGKVRKPPAQGGGHPVLGVRWVSGHLCEFVGRGPVGGRRGHVWHTPEQRYTTLETLHIIGSERAPILFG